MTTEMSAERRRQLLRATEEMVTAHRIEAITREHASIANLLDHREIFDLDEIQIKQGKFVKIEADSRVQSRRGARAETEIKPAANQAVESFKEKGVNVQLLSGEYDLELRIWKEKSSKAAYAEQRKFQYPELEVFLAKMPKKQKNEYKQKIGAAIIKLADKCREECKRLKADMDLNGIFHPEANAHRVHCIYLTMLHKNISAKTIETPVLKEMYREEQKIRREEAARDEEKIQLLREMEERDRNAEKLRGRMSRRSMDMSQISVASPSTHDTSNDSLRRNDANKDDASQGSIKKKLGAKKASIINNSATKPSKLKKMNSMSSTSSLPMIQGSVKVKSGLTEIPSASTGTASSPQARKEKIQLEPPEKSFKRKLRQSVADGQVTNVFTADTQNTLLANEVARLQQAETMQFKRPKDRTDAWADSMSQWMLQDLQAKQVSRVAAGTVSNVGASLGSPVRQASFAASSPHATAGAAFPDGGSSHSSATGAIYSMGLTDSSGLQLQQQIDLQRQQEQQKEQWKAFGKAAVLAVDQFLSENEPAEPVGSVAADLARFQQHQSPTGGMRGVYSPSKYVPFDQFYDILKKQADPLLEAVLDVDDAVLLPASLAATQPLPHAASTQQIQSQTQTQTQTHPNALRRVMSMSAAVSSAGNGGVAMAPPPLTSSLSMHHLSRTQQGSFNELPIVSSSGGNLQLQLQLQPPTHIHNSTINNNNNTNNNSSNNNSNNNGKGTLNIVDVMRNQLEPTNFTAFEKVQELTLPSAKLLARLNGTGAAHRRSVSHLGSVGHTAIELRDSFGRLGRDANKGFDNLFSSQRLPERHLLLATRGHSSHPDGGGGVAASRTHTKEDDNDNDDDPFLDNDDVVRRLERTGDIGGERTHAGKTRVTDLDNTVSSSGVVSPVTPSGGNVSFRGVSRQASPYRRHRATGGTRSSSPSHYVSRSPTKSPGTGRGSERGGAFFPNEAEMVWEDAGDEDDDNNAAALATVSEEDLDLQHKLTATWDTLGVSANDRLSFMLKYSADVYAAEMSRAIDLWAGVAVCHTLLQRLMDLREKTQRGLLLLPTTALQLWRHILRPVPSLLRLNHEALVPPSLVFVHNNDYNSNSFEQQQQQQQQSSNSRSNSPCVAPPPSAVSSSSSSAAAVPYSVRVIWRLQHVVCATFAEHAPESMTLPRHAIHVDAVSSDNASSVSGLSRAILQQFRVEDLSLAKAVLHDLLRHVSQVLQVLLLRARNDFDDDIPCGSHRHCRDFLQSVVSLLNREEDGKTPV